EPRNGTRSVREAIDLSCASAAPMTIGMTNKQVVRNADTSRALSTFGESQQEIWDIEIADRFRWFERKPTAITILIVWHCVRHLVDIFSALRLLATHVTIALKSNTVHSPAQEHP